MSAFGTDNGPAAFVTHRCCCRYCTDFTERQVHLSTATAAKLIAFDTNWLIHNLGDTKCRVADITSRHPDTSILVPKEVLRELDRLKTGGKDDATRYNVSTYSLSMELVWFCCLSWRHFVPFRYLLFIFLDNSCGGL